DYIAMPKFNMYQSLHTTVFGPDGRPVEIQIRTFEMHQRAEYGVAAHWKYKEDPNKSRTAAPEESKELSWVRQLVDWQMETTDPAEFLDSLRYEMAGTQVYVFTPKGDVISLAGGATPVDFAYAVHTEVGHRTVGARVNGRLVPLDSHLENGDTVEVFTSQAPDASPSRDWLNFVASPRARNKIRAWFTKERREEAIDAGKAQLAKAMRKQNLPIQRLMNHQSLTALAADMRIADVSGLYAAIGENHVSASTVVQRLVRMVGGDAGAEEDLSEATIPGTQVTRKRSGSDPGIVVEGMDSSTMWVKLARCCTPVPGDPIVGFVTRGSGISVHRSDCGNVEQLEAEPERMISVAWDKAGTGLFLVQVQIEALDRSGLLSEITRVLSDNHVNILAATSTTSRDRLATLRFTFEMADTEHLGHLLATVRRIDGVFDAFRVTGSRRKDNSD
nr:bifunctional (p)ppGpp synthetase/guanosine-3',5'-bis(diphosphate) 3'-pyrophosphohydrolase [Actinomycetales bacterium]